MGKIITISRQYGSGGSEIGRKVAKALSIPYYDRTIIDVTAKESGFDPKYIERAEQTTTTSFLSVSYTHLDLTTTLSTGRTILHIVR